MTMKEANMADLSDISLQFGGLKYDEEILQHFVDFCEKIESLNQKLRVFNLQSFRVENDLIFQIDQIKAEEESLTNQILEVNQN